MTSLPETGRKPQGLALIEVLIALALLAGGTAALLRLQLQAMEAQNENLLRHQAMRLAHECMSRLLHATADKRYPGLLCPQPPGWRLHLDCNQTRCRLVVTLARHRIRTRYRLEIPVPRASS